MVAVDVVSQKRRLGWLAAVPRLHRVQVVPVLAPWLSLPALARPSLRSGFEAARAYKEMHTNKQGNVIIISAVKTLHPNCSTAQSSAHLLVRKATG
jgi:hypothetical protein